MKMVKTAKALVVTSLVATLAIASPGCLTTKSVANTASFGLIGNKQKIAEEKSQKQQHEQEKKEADQKAYAEKQAQKRTKEDAKVQRKADEKAAKKAKKNNTAAPVEKAEPKKKKRGFWSKATFGIVGGKKKSGEPETKTAEAAAPADEKQAAKEAKKQEDRDRKAAEKQAKEDKKAQEKQAKTDREQAKKEAKAADTQVAAAPTDSQATTASTDTKEPASEPEQPKHKRSFLSRATFGLVGGSGEKQEAESKEEKPKKEKKHKEEEQAEAAPVKTAEVAEPVVETPAEPVTPIASEHRGVAHLPFRTAVSTVNQTASGLPKIVASRRTYSSNGYGITDIGDVRIAVKGMTFSDETRAEGVVIQSDERGVAAGKSGKGNESFAFEYSKGVTTCTFGSVQFTVSKAVLNVDGHDVPVGKGRRLIVVNDGGKVDAVYNIGG